MSSHSPSPDGVVLVTNMENYLQLHQLTAPNPGLFSYLQFVKSDLSPGQTTAQSSAKAREDVKYIKNTLAEHSTDHTDQCDVKTVNKEYYFFQSRSPCCSESLTAPCSGLSCHCLITHLALYRMAVSTEPANQESPDCFGP